MDKIVLTRSQKLSPLAFKRLLVSFGYRKAAEVLRGSFKDLGDRVIVWPILENSQYKIDFLGNNIEAIISATSDQPCSQLKIDANYFILDKEKVLPGTFIVHLDYGIGEFLGLTYRVIDKVKKIFIELRYAKDAHLFVPLERLNLLSVYQGLGRIPKLSSLSSKTWQNTKARVEASVISFARELLFIYAKRAVFLGPAFKWNKEWQSFLEKSFPYKLTEDQKQALQAVYKDLQSRKPMDRLLCGDAGFGKTEVAIRASVHTVAAGWQTAVLAPTTVLAEQHLATFEQRLKDLPIRIARLSRFTPKEEEQKILADLKNGKIDIIIGTHRLLSSDVQFKKLGLLIIDEEQRFGVRHKEKLKKLRANLNVLTISATPIPRTLFLSLSGLRDLSVIQTPPLGRKAVTIYVAPLRPALIKRAILEELKRGGQVYYLFNSVARMPLKYRSLLELLSGTFKDKKIKIAIAHGRMKEEELAKVMHDFALGEIDVLLCTTIIQSGLDLPNVNTLIVEEGERLGLADLYQLKGRVGRGYRKAYAYFFYKKTLSRSAQKRLQAFSEFKELGQGYQVALRDLDIRGGGNILGREQSGNMEAVGLVLYTRLLKEAIRRLKKGELKAEARSFL